MVIKPWTVYLLLLTATALALFSGVACPLLVVRKPAWTSYQQTLGSVSKTTQDVGMVWACHVVVPVWFGSIPTCACFW